MMTQAERSAASRALLIDTSIECLAAHGYSGASIPVILERAGLSRGALWGHFKTRAALMAAAAVTASEVMDAEVARRFDELIAKGETRLDAAVDAFYSCVGSAQMQAMFELVRAARVDAELFAELVAVNIEVGATYERRLEKMLGLEHHTDVLLSQKSFALLLQLHGASMMYDVQSVQGREETHAAIRATAAALFAR